MASVLHRVWKILRADVEGRLSGRDGRRPDARGRSRGPEPRRQANAPEPPSVDPELAGYYSNLEVPYGADLETARAAWRRLARQYHPDLHGADPERQRVATELLKGLNHAFEQLERRLEKRG